MVRKLNFPMTLAIQALSGSFLLLFLSQCSHPPEALTAKAELRDIEVIVSTNGIIEPIDSIGIYAPVSGFVITIHQGEGSEVVQGQPLIDLDASQARLSLAEAKASLLQAQRQARIVLTGPPKEELDSLDASIEENTLELRQVTEELSTEEPLYQKGAVSKKVVEDLKKQRELLEVGLKALKLKKENLLTRYSEEEKKLEQDNVAVLADQVRLLEGQVQDAAITVSENGTLYSLSIKPGSFVNQGQLLAQIYQPGQVRLRAYIDEPDLGRVRKGQRVAIEWDGIAERKWDGIVETPAERAVALNNRSVGHVLCTIEGEPAELLPNINVKVRITTDLKTGALTVPRSAVFSHEGKSAVLLPDGEKTVIQPVEVGLASYNEIEILQGIKVGDSIINNPREVLAVE